MIKPFLKIFSRIFRAADESTVETTVPVKVMPKLEDYLKLSPDKTKMIKLSKLLTDGTYKLIGVELIHSDHAIGHGRLCYDNLKLIYRDTTLSDIEPESNYLLWPVPDSEKTGIVCVAYNDILGMVEDYLEGSISEFTFGTFGYIDL
jgi:hypothetical protein